MKKRKLEQGGKGSFLDPVREVEPTKGDKVSRAQQVATYVCERVIQQLNIDKGT